MTLASSASDLLRSGESERAEDSGFRSGRRRLSGRQILPLNPDANPCPFTPAAGTLPGHPIKSSLLSSCNRWRSLRDSNPCFRGESDSLERDPCRSRSSLGKFRRRVTKISSAPWQIWPLTAWPLPATGGPPALPSSDATAAWSGSRTSPTRKWRSAPPLKYPPPEYAHLDDELRDWQQRSSRQPADLQAGARHPIRLMYGKPKRG
jgi:hypothetical protein